MSLRLPSFVFLHPRLTRVRDDILRRYPAGQAARPRSRLSNLSALLRRIRNTPREKLPGLARRLTPADVDTLVFAGLSIPDDLDVKVRDILGWRWRQRFAPTLWNHFLQSPQRRALARFASLAAERNAAALPIQIDAEQVSHALDAEDWLVSLSRLLESEHGTLGDKCEKLGLRLNTPASWLVATKLLRSLNAEQFEAETGPFLTTALQKTYELSSTDFVAAVDHYLITVPVARFHWDILEFIYQEMGRPEKAPSRWRDISEPARAKFKQWLARRLMDEILAGDHDRLEFWRHFADYLRNGFVVTAGTAKAIVMIFPTFVAVEFLAVGNACYLYTLEEYDKYLRKLVEIRGKCDYESDLKHQIYGSLVGNTGNNRIFHRGGWQVVSYPIIHRLLTGGVS